MTSEKRLTLLELLNLANEAYPDGFLAEYYDARTGKRLPGGGIPSHALSLRNSPRRSIQMHLARRSCVKRALRSATPSTISKW
jgi:hypothetical protein